MPMPDWSSWLPEEMQMSPRATLHTAKLYAAPYWATLHPTEFYCILFCAPSELCCTPLSCACILLISYNTPYLATLHPFELWCSLLSYPLPSCWTMLYPSELRCTLLSHGALYWATIELRCTLLSHAEPFSVMLNPTELRWILLSYAVPYWDMLFSTEDAVPWELHYYTTA